MEKFGIVGHFGQGQNLTDGQTIKTKILNDELNHLLNLKVRQVDTHHWKKRPLRLLRDCVKLIKSCENVIMMPAQNGVKVFIPLFVILNLIFRRKLHYVVIGGWLADLLKKNKKLVPFIRRVTSIHVETDSMIRGLKEAGIHKTYYMPNFKNLKKLELQELVYDHNIPLKLCTFSRVMEEKGIEDAIEAVTNINTNKGRVIYTLDIYGAIDPTYKERFESILKKSKDFIQYRGVIAYDQSVDVIKHYFLLLFPTYYYGEGFAGTLLDAFAAGVPVLATNWKHNGEIIKDGQNGFLYDRNDGGLQRLLEDIQTSPDTVLNMKKTCLTEYERFKPRDVVEKFLSEIRYYAG